MSMRISVTVDDGGLARHLADGERKIPKAIRMGVKHVAERGADFARELAPVRLGYLESAIASRSVGSDAEVYVRAGTPLEGGDTAGGGPRPEGVGYSWFNEFGNSRTPRVLYMRRASERLEAGAADTIMDQDIYLALAEAGLDPDISGLLGL